MNKLILKLAIISAVVFLSSCGGDSSPGYEFMPNMYDGPSLKTYEKHTIKNLSSVVLGSGLPPSLPGNNPFLNK